MTNSVITQKTDENPLPFLTTLDAAQRQHAGVPEIYRFASADQVRFFEIDALNHVNNVAYFRWFETLRVKYLQMIQRSKYLENDTPVWVVSANAARYLRPVYFGDVYVTATRAVSFRQSSFVMEYGVWVNGTKVAEGESVQVSLAQDGSGKQPLSEELIAVLREEGAVKS